MEYKYFIEWNYEKYYLFHDLFGKKCIYISKFVTDKSEYKKISFDKFKKILKKHFIATIEEVMMYLNKNKYQIINMIKNGKLKHYKKINNDNTQEIKSNYYDYDNIHVENQFIVKPKIDKILSHIVWCNGTFDIEFIKYHKLGTHLIHIKKKCKFNQTTTTSYELIKYNITFEK